MVVLAASICTKAGKPVISRQFREITRARVEGLLTSFPKLIPTNTQHTSVETADVRYVYQPLEDLYILLITNKGSNILQDIDTLHLFARVVSDLCRSADEKEILKNAFELLSAFDEIVSLGYRENVNLMQVKSILEMESHEERIQEIIARNKEAEAKEELKRRAKQLEMQRQQSTRRNMGGSGYLGSGLGSSYQSVPRFETPSPQQTRSASPATPSSARQPAFKGSGMKLGKKAKQTDLLDALGGEVITPNDSMPTTPAPGTPTIEASEPKLNLPSVPQEEIHVTTTEHISLTLLQQGGIKALEIKGDLSLLISSAAKSRVRLALASLPPTTADLDARELQFKYHPNLARSGSGLEKEIKLKDPSRSWPVGQPLGVLRWRVATKDEGIVPLSINCWPAPTGDGTCDVNIEYELENDKLELFNLVISIPLPTGTYPTVGQHTGSWAIDPNSHSLTWTIPSVSADADSRTGSMEFSIGGEDPTAFFPLNVNFSATGSVIGIEISGVVSAESGEETVFSQEASVIVDEYQIV